MSKYLLQIQSQPAFNLSQERLVACLGNSTCSGTHVNITTKYNVSEQPPAIIFCEICEILR